jgi:hypothetical protein
MIERTRVEGPLRTKQWAQAALTRADLELRWFVTRDEASALAAERRLIALVELWNRRRQSANKVSGADCLVRARSRPFSQDRSAEARQFNRLAVARAVDHG